MKKARIALIVAGIAVVMLSLLYVVATGKVFSALASKLVLTLSLCLLETAAIMRIIDDHRSGRSVTMGVILAVAIAIVGFGGIMEG